MSSIIGSRRREAAASHRGRSLRRRAAAAAAALAALVGLGASAANAEVLLWSANINEQRFDTAGLVDLNGTAAGGTTLTFATTQANQRVIITFNTQCYIATDQSDGNHAAFAKVEIIVDPAGPVGEIVVPPTSSGDLSLCGRNDVLNTPGDTESAVVVASARPAQAGTNQVKVRVTPIQLVGGSAAYVGLEEMSLAVTR